MTPRTLKCYSWIAALCLFSARGAAQPSPPPSMSTARATDPLAAQQLLDEYVRLALTNSPTLSSLRAKHAAAREMVAPAGALPDPMVGMMYQSVGAPWEPMAPMSMVQGEISQSIPGSGKRQARRNAADAEAAIRKAELDAVRHRLAGQVRELFAQIYATDKERQAVESAEQLIDLLVGAVTGQFSSGTVDQEALLKAEFERSKLREQLNDIATNRQILSVRLNSLLSRRETENIPRLDELPEIPEKFDEMSMQQTAHAPDLRVQRAAIAGADRRRELAEKEARPNYLIGLSGGTTTNALPVITLRFAMEIPIWSSTKQDPLIRAAQHDIEATTDEYRAVERKIRGEMQELVLRFHRDTEQCRLYRERIVPNAEQTLRAARNAYAMGRGNFATVIEDFRTWLDAQVGLARRQADRLAAWSALQAIRGDAH